MPRCRLRPSSRSGVTRRLRVAAPPSHHLRPLDYRIHSRLGTAARAGRARDGEQCARIIEFSTRCSLPVIVQQTSSPTIGVRRWVFPSTVVARARVTGTLWYPAATYPNSSGTAVSPSAMSSAIPGTAVPRDSYRT